MTVFRGFAIVLASAVAFGVLGTLLGYAIGVYAPDYYRTVLQIPPGMQLNPVQIGLGLGLTQGAGAGFAVGAVIVVAVAWYESRLLRAPEAK
jgi:hypothetical protein